VKELHTLIEQTRAGQQAAYEQIVRRFQDMAVGYAASLLNDYHLAEDAAQEAFISAYLNLNKLNDAEAFPGWFRQIVRSQCRRMQRRIALPVVEIEQAEQIADASADPQADFSAGQERDLLIEALQVLSERDRSIVMLFYISDFTQKEIAAFLGVPSSTINNRLHLSRKRLQGKLKKMSTANVRAKRPSHDETFAHSVQKRLQSLETLHHKLAGGLEKIIGQTLEREAHVQVSAVEQTTFTAFLDALPSPSLTLHFLMQPSSGRIIFDLSPELALAVEEKVVGFGSSNWSDVHNSMNEEQWSQMGAFGRAIDQSLRQTWKSVMAIELADGEWETNIVGFMRRPDFRELPSAEKLANLHDDPNGLIVRVELKATSGDLHCQLALCYPAATLETLLPHMG